MENSESNKQAAAKHREAISQIEAQVMEMKNLAFQSRSMIEENRLMILGNYSATFMGNRQLANSNTDDIFKIRDEMLNAMVTEGELQENYVDALKNKAKLDFLKHRSQLNSSVLAISERLAAINSALVEINSEIMGNNAKIAIFNAQQLAENSKILEESLSAPTPTPDTNAEIIDSNSAAIEALSANVSRNKSKIKEILATSAKNSERLRENKEIIYKRRQSILENRKKIEAFKAKSA